MFSELISAIGLPMPADIRGLDANGLKPPGALSIDGMVGEDKEVGNPV